MSKQHRPGHALSFAVLFLLFLLALATGPIGFALFVMAGVPIAILVGFESMAHNQPKPR